MLLAALGEIAPWCRNSPLSGCTAKVLSPGLFWILSRSAYRVISGGVEVGAVGSRQWQHREGRRGGDVKITEQSGSEKLGSEAALSPFIFYSER